MPPFATTFAFCFDMNEGILLFSGFQALTALFWLGSGSFAEEAWPSSGVMRGISITLLMVNALVGSVAARTSNERCALCLAVLFGVLLLCLTIDFGLSHPSQCDDPAMAEDSAIGARHPSPPPSSPPCPSRLARLPFPRSIPCTGPARLTCLPPLSHPLCAPHLPAAYSRQAG